MTRSQTPQPIRPVHGLAAIVGFLVCVELASGVLQGYYTPIFSDIADHLDIADADVNWFEAAQLIVSALVVPPLARLGDLVGHKKVLLLSTAVTALGSWILASRRLHDVPHRLGGPGRVRRVAAARGRDHPPADQGHRPAGAPHPARGGDPGRRPRAGGHHRRADLGRPGRGDLDDPARAAGDRRDRRVLRDLVRHRGRAGRRDRRLRLGRPGAGHGRDRPGDGRARSDPGPVPGQRVRLGC